MKYSKNKLTLYRAEVLRASNKDGNKCLFSNGSLLISKTNNNEINYF